MKILITYASAGAGHWRVATALFSYLKENRPDLELELVDILSKTNALFRFDYTKGYTFLVRHAVALWYFCFWLTGFKLLRPITRLIAYHLNQVNTYGFKKYLTESEPDYILSTHFLPSEIAAHLRSNYKIHSKVVTIITDFGVHPFWVNKGTDFYIVASDYTKNKLIEQGVPKEKIKAFGLPSDSKFLKQYDRVALASKFGVSADMFTVLLMTGSFGIGPLEDIARLINEEVQVLIVCAGNEKLFNRLSKIKLKNVKVFGFVNNAEELMAISDIIVTKPGGSTIAELINMELVPIFITAIPGQEEENMRALGEFGVGVYPKNIFKIRDVILDLKNSPDKMQKARDSVRKIKKPFSCREIASVIR